MRSLGEPSASAFRMKQERTKGRRYSCLAPASVGPARPESQQFQG
jgi:hypothetical protein